MHNLGIKLKSFSYRKLDYLNEWPFPLEILESLTVGSVSDKLVVKIMDKSTNLKHLELGCCDNWPTFLSRLLSLKFKTFYNNEQLFKFRSRGYPYPSGTLSE